MDRVYNKRSFLSKGYNLRTETPINKEINPSKVHNHYFPEMGPSNRSDSKRFRKSSVSTRNSCSEIKLGSVEGNRRSNLSRYSYQIIHARKKSSNFPYASLDYSSHKKDQLYCFKSLPEHRQRSDYFIRAAIAPPNTWKERLETIERMKKFDHIIKKSKLLHQIK